MCGEGGSRGQRHACGDVSSLCVHHPTGGRAREVLVCTLTPFPSRGSSSEPSMVVGAPSGGRQGRPRDRLDPGSA